MEQLYKTEANQKRVTKQSVFVHHNSDYLYVWGQKHSPMEMIYIWGKERSHLICMSLVMLSSSKIMK